MATKKSKSKYKKHYGAVLLLDSLGTKGAWKGKNAEKVLDNWELFVDTFKKIFVPRGKEFNSKYKMFAFSDTIIFVVTSKDKTDLLLAASFAGQMMVTGGMILDIYFRGCFSIGEFYESKNMILGPAIDEAAQYYEKGDWIGVFACPSAFSAILRSKNKIDEELFDESFLEYDVPMKMNKPYKTFALPLDNDFGSWKDMVKVTMIEFIHDKLENSGEIEGFEKWKNMLNFMYYLISEKRS